MARSPLARVVVAARIAAALRTAAPGVMAGLAGLGVVAATAGPARAHHVGAYVPRDNDVSANFKQLKFSLQARKFEVAARLYETGALKRELRARAAALPPGLEARIAAALRAGDARAAETGLMVFFAALVRELALEADRQLADARAPASVRAAGANKFLEAIWRYYNLVDFAVTERDPKAAAAVRLAFDDAEGAAKAAPPAPDRIRAPLQRIARVLGDVVAASAVVGPHVQRGLRRDT
jgi:hypothetical protein